MKIKMDKKEVIALHNRLNIIMFEVYKRMGQEYDPKEEDDEEEKRLQIKDEVEDTLYFQTGIEA